MLSLPVGLPSNFGRSFQTGVCQAYQSSLVSLVMQIDSQVHAQVPTSNVTHVLEQGQELQGSYCHFYSVLRKIWHLGTFLLTWLVACNLCCNASIPRDTDQKNAALNTVQQCSQFSVLVTLDLEGWTLRSFCVSVVYALRGFWGVTSALGVRKADEWYRRAMRESANADHLLPIGAVGVYRDAAVAALVACPRPGAPPAMPACQRVISNASICLSLASVCWRWRQRSVRDTCERVQK